MPKEPKLRRPKREDLVQGALLKCGRTGTIRTIVGSKRMRRGVGRPTRYYFSGIYGGGFTFTWIKSNYFLLEFQ